MAIRTTEDAVKGIIDVDPDISLTPFIETSNNLVDQVCLTSSYSDAILELIERWLSAHFYAVRDPRVKMEQVKGIEQEFAIAVKATGFGETPYGLQAMTLDIKGNLALLDQARPRIPVQIIHLGTNARRLPRGY